MFFFSFSLFIIFLFSSLLLSMTVDGCHVIQDDSGDVLNGEKE